MEENVVYFLVAYQESKFRSGDVHISESSLPQAIANLKIARECLLQLRDECATKGKVSPVMDDAFTAIFEDKHVVTWTIAQKNVITDLSQFMLNS